MPVPNIVEFVEHETFLDLSLSAPQRALLRVIYGLELNQEEEDLYHRCTGRLEPYKPGNAFHEVTVVAGRRAGKDSRIACPIALYEAIFGGYEEELGKGERGLIPLVAQDERSTRVAFVYIRDYLVNSPLLRRMLVEELKSELRLSNRICVTAFACTAKSLRGWSIPCAIMDEVAFFRSESGSTVDYEMQKSIRPAGASFVKRGQRLIKISTPHVKAGVIWDDYHHYYGQENADVLVWQASSGLMNPKISEKMLAREARVDAHNFAREYEALFADMTEGAIPGALIDAAIVEGRAAIPPSDRYDYVAAVDPSGGANDEFALSIIHVEDGRFIQDFHRAWPGSRHAKVDLAAIVQEIARMLKLYGLNRIIGDKYAGDWPDQEFRKVHVQYVPFEGSKSDAYREMIPMFSTLRVEILDDTVLIRQLRLLQLTRRIGGKASVIDAPKGSTDDRANALAFAVATKLRSMAPACDIGFYARPGWEVGVDAAATPVPAGAGDPESRRMWRELRGDRPGASMWGRREGDARGRRFFG